MDVKQAKIKGWLTMGAVLCLLWGFAQVVGPWGEAHIPVFNEIVDTIKARDIDSGAYFYTEIEASYTGERALRDAQILKRPDQFGFTPSFISGVLLSLVILIVGFKTLPMD